MVVVSELVQRIIQASARSTASHYDWLFSEDSPVASIDQHQLASEIASGYTHDLDDNVAWPVGFGFRHLQTTREFYNALSSLLRNELEPARHQGGLARSNRGVDSHIWAQDYDRRLRSLFPTGRAIRKQNEGLASGQQSSVYQRSRISAVVQQALLRSRVGLQNASSTAVDSDRLSLFLPSPFFVAYNVLTDPYFPGSDVIAGAALQAEIRRRVTNVYGPFRLDYDTISQALQTVDNRVGTSKTVLERTPAVQFLCHTLAMRGLMNTELIWPNGEQPRQRLIRDWLDFAQIERESPPALCGFRLHPSTSGLPDAGELLNDLEGLPLPIEGGRQVFQGGIRFAAGGDLVAAVSGPFGAGKTSACLSLAASLAPLACRTLYLTCEEEPEDIFNRLQEAAPANIRISSPLFAAVSLNDLRRRELLSTWFNAHTLRLPSYPSQPARDIIADLQGIFEDALAKAPLFSKYPEDRSENEEKGLPSFARPVIIVDGLHQLFREAGNSDANFDGALRMLVDRCRELNAIFIFTVAEHAPETIRLDYLCDLVIRLDREGYDDPDGALSRLFKLLKARRQPAHMGAHRFYLSSPKGFRIKPNVGSRAESVKQIRWSLPNRGRQILLTGRLDDVAIEPGSQVLVYGLGSSGKAGLGMLILHRRPTLALYPKKSQVDALDGDQLPFDDRLPGDGQKRDHQEEDEIAPITASEDTGSTIPFPDQSPYYEARVLVISFLYPEGYYRDIARQLGTSRIAAGGRTYSGGHSGPPHRQSHLPDRASIDVISLYPGRLRVEELLSKVENSLNAAVTRGLPHTGVLLDGIHNIFVQFPDLERSELFWPQLYSLLRRRGVTVVTTHTQLSLPQSAGSGLQREFFNDFEHARRQAAPLLSVLISSADYVFDLSAVDTNAGVQFRLTMKSGLYDVAPGYLEWDRADLKLGARQYFLAH
jgi:KaiC/GvpD/RAD55 family RecA-like ATPase